MRPVHVDDCLRYARAVPTLSAGRVYRRGSVFARTGSLAASVTQEWLWRLERNT